MRNLHRKCLSEPDRLLPENTNHPSSEGTFLIPTPSQPKSTGGTRLRLRRGTDRDAVAVSALYLRARKAAKAAIPMTARTDDEVRRWIAERVVARTELWVAEDDGGALVGVLVLDEDRLEQLYVEPTLIGRGIGSELIGLAKRARPEGLRLWTFEANLGAQRIYERHGFRPMERTAGDNEE
jgi:GNAT superfamily N-acetyltransferase